MKQYSAEGLADISEGKGRDVKREGRREHVEGTRPLHPLLQGNITWEGRLKAGNSY